MANRQFYQFRYSLVPMVTDIYASISFGAAGAPTLDTANSKGVVSVTRNSAGLYTFVFGTSSGRLDPYTKLLHARQVFQNATAPAAPGMYIVSDNSANPLLASLQVQFNSAGTATDPGSGEVLKMDFCFKNSSVK